MLHQLVALFVLHVTQHLDAACIRITCRNDCEGLFVDELEKHRCLVDVLVTALCSAFAGEQSEDIVLVLENIRQEDKFFLRAVNYVISLILTHKTDS